MLDSALWWVLCVLGGGYCCLSLKSKFTARVKLTLFLSLCLALLYLFMPEKAKNSAPFHRFPELDIAMLSCKQVLSRAQFCSDAQDRGWDDNSCFCSNNNALSTVAFCYETAYAEQIDAFINRCNSDYNTNLTHGSFQQALDNYHKHARDLDLPQSVADATPIDFPVKLSTSEILIYKEAYDQFLGNYNRSITYGWLIIYYWLFIFGLAALGNWCLILFPRVCNTFTGPLSRAFRSKLTIPALKGKNKTQESRMGYVFDYLAPTRVESLAIAVFTALVIHLTFLNIHYVPDGPFFPTKTAAYCRYFAVRSGILASYMAPLSILFAGRNNILQGITRWNYSTFVTFHRWISRVMMLLIIVHGIGYGIRYIKPPHRHVRLFITVGIVSGYAGVLMVIQGLLFLRRTCYEVFLCIHIALALIFVGGAWFHVKDLWFLWFYFVTASLWALDRAIRVQRVVSFGFPLAQVFLHEDSTLKFKVPVPPGFHTEGGGHCFVHFLRWLCFWQSHPFTYTTIEGHIIFYVKAKTGITDQLKRYLETHPGKSAHIRVAVEGSYGEATPAARYASSVFVAGGNGIPGVYAEALQVRHLTPADARVTLMWVVRDAVSVLWFFDELKALESEDIETLVYVTRPQNDVQNLVHDKSGLLTATSTHHDYGLTEISEDPIRCLTRELRSVKFKEGRPDIGKIVEVSVTESPGSTCFVTCGHPIMVDELRYQVAQVVGKSTKRVDYFEQLQVWA